MPDALIHLRIPAETKGRWVRESRAAGMRLTDWIIKIVEAHMAKATVRAEPGSVDFESGWDDLDEVIEVRYCSDSEQWVEAD